MLSITTEVWNNQTISFACTDLFLNGVQIPKGYVNASEMCKSNNSRQWSEYSNRGASLSFFNALAEYWENNQLRKTKDISLENWAKAFCIFTSVTKSKKSREKQISSFIYLISDCHGSVKIGYTSNLRERLKTLQTSNSSSLRLLNTFRGGLKEERRLHHYLKTFHKKGEWFSLDVVNIVSQELIDSFSFSKTSASYPFLILNISRDVWVHPKIAANLAQWIDFEFYFWISEKLENLMKVRQTHLNSSKVFNMSAKEFEAIQLEVQSAEKEKDHKKLKSLLDRLTASIGID